MIKILYLGKNYLDVIDKIPKGEKFVILDNDEFSKHGDSDFIKYVDSLEDLYGQNSTALRLMIKKGLNYDNSLLRDYLIVDDFYKALPPFRKIGLYGDKDLMIKFIKFLTSYYRCGFKINTGSWQTEFFTEESLLTTISVYNGQIDLHKNGLLEIILDGSKTDVNIFLWNGKLEDIYKWKNMDIDNKNYLLSRKFFAMRRIKEKWKIKAYFTYKYNIKKIWESICYDYNML